jgi:alpha-L-arabinofuranosidase
MREVIWIRQAGERINDHVYGQVRRHVSMQVYVQVLKGVYDHVRGQVNAGVSRQFKENLST